MDPNLDMVYDFSIKNFGNNEDLNDLLEGALAFLYETGRTLLILNNHNYNLLSRSRYSIPSIMEKAIIINSDKIWRYYKTLGLFIPIETENINNQDDLNRVFEKFAIEDNEISQVASFLSKTLSKEKTRKLLEDEDM